MTPIKAAAEPSREALLALVDKIRGGTRDGWGYSRDECAEFIRLSAPAGNAGLQELENDAFRGGLSAEGYAALTGNVGGLPLVQRIEMVSGIFSEEAAPMWRVMVDKYCADFETETAANNFRGAILALPQPREAEPVAWRWRLSSANEWRYGDYQPRAVIQEIEIQPLYASRSPIPEAPGVREDIVEQMAKWLHDETAHPDSYPSHTWPETERDDGQREGGFVKIVPSHGQAYFRDIARRLVARFVRALKPQDGGK